jgi:hypothetical protein
MLRPKKINKPCKSLHVYVTIKVDSLLPFVVQDAELATSVEEATNHFAVGVAFIITRFFFVQLPKGYRQQGFRCKEQFQVSMVMRLGLRVTLLQEKLLLSRSKEHLNPPAFRVRTLTQS